MFASVTTIFRPNTSADVFHKIDPARICAGHLTPRRSRTTGTVQDRRRRYCASGRAGAPSPRRRLAVEGFLPESPHPSVETMSARTLATWQFLTHLHYHHTDILRR